jgi:uncharacterized membrane protein YhiD involved in acid resistance
MAREFRSIRAADAAKRLRAKRAAIVAIDAGLLMATAALIYATVGSPGNVGLGLLMVTLVMVSIPFVYISGARWHGDSPEKAEQQARPDEANAAAEKERRAYTVKLQLANEHLRQSKIEAERREREQLAAMERERAEQEEIGKRDLEEARLRAMFKKFIAEEMGKNIKDVESMFATWNENNDTRDKI